MQWGAVLAVAKADWRSRWRGSLVIGLMFGLIGGCVLAILTVAQRTDSAFPRLVAAVHRPDAVTHVVGAQDALLQKVASLPGVEESWAPHIWVGQLDSGPLTYLSVIAGPGHPADLVRPVLLEGREPREGSPHEVLLSEDYARASGVSAGSTIDMTLLTGQQVARFGVGFGKPAGPRVTLHVVGIGRMPLWGSDAGTAIATPAFTDRYVSSSAGHVSFLRLAPGDKPRRNFDRAFTALATANPAPPELAELGPPQVRYPTATEDPLVAPVRRVLVAGLTMSAGVTAVAALLITTQALNRRHAQSLTAHRVEAALGMTRLERAVARTAAALPGATVAGSTSTATGLAAGLLEPLGALRAFEPTPGYLPNPGIALIGGTSIALIHLALSGATAAAVLRSTLAGNATPRRGPWLPLVRRSPVLLAGLRMAWGPGQGHGTGMAAQVLGLAAVVTLSVAVSTFSTSLDRLVSTPSRYGAPADISLMDAKAPDVARLATDARVAAIDVVSIGEVVLAGEMVRAYAYRPVKSAREVTVISGRRPAAADEVALGPRLADQLQGRKRDGRLVVTLADGSTATLRVVGVITNQPIDASERLGASAVLSPSGLDRVAVTPPRQDARITAEPGRLEALRASMEHTLEIYGAETPREITTLDGLRPLLDFLTSVLASGVVIAVTHSLWQTRRRSRRATAVVRALGFTPARVGALRVTMVAALVAPALALGVPMGLGLGRLVWWEVATTSGVEGDVLLPGAWVTAAALAVLVASMVLPTAWTRKEDRAVSTELRAE
ncbi:FtsX-like permease family protein [Streptomyces sp. SID12501]|uniref:ABC3 transporter permease C-terminal domain-containing protein n=1 Tax=Streptomyces sp. SID12501 TaxID=2706042 RepID=A0A6B3BYX8_9ACTN|nr:FtsX-like permease family protein [Streptomyces sp. SID12501]NEC89512.1 hypothetical protein [Streptomyces sp. SID12501]